MTRFVRFLLLLTLCGSLFAGLPASVVGASLPAAAQDWAIEGGRFYTQTNGEPAGESERGFALADNEYAMMWTEYRKLGGVRGVGYPVSTRFRLDGFVVQATERAVLQWRPDEQRVELFNVMDRLHDMGKDVWLRDTQFIPAQATFPNEQGMTFDQIVLHRESLLDASPAIRDRYFSVAAPMVLYGLPTSAVEDVGPALAVRFQRTVMFEWQETMPFAAVGEVSFAYVGDLARRPEIRLVPEEAARPVKSPERIKATDLASLAMNQVDVATTFPDSALEPMPSAEPDQAGVERLVFSNQKILHGPFAFTTLAAGFDSVEEATTAFAQMAAVDAEVFEFPTIGDESIALRQIDPGDSMAHATFVVWRREQFVLAVGAAGFDPFLSDAQLTELIYSVDERAATADTPPDAAALEVPALGFGDLWALRPIPIGVARTSVAGSSNDRMQNLMVATAALNNAVLQPGQELSLNDTVGPTTEERGFRMGYAIIGSDTVPDVGGGICQVSTTLFQAAFAAGLEITERNPHAYWIPRYRITGLDATVYAPSLDFRFRNDMSEPVLVQGWPSGGELVFAIFSEAPPRRVEIAEPEVYNVIPADTEIQKRYSTRLANGEQVQVETAHNGFSVDVTRDVYEGDALVHHDVITSYYRPAANVILIGGVEPPSADVEEQPEFRPGRGFTED